MSGGRDRPETGHCDRGAADAEGCCPDVLKVSLSWLAKARMRGDGPPYIQVGRSIRYAEAALIQWMKSRQRSSTSEQ